MSNAAILKTGILSVLLILVAMFYFSVTGKQTAPTLIILDTDISSDVDDVGAVAVLHSLADQGKTEILAMMVSSGDLWSVPCLDSLNTWFGRPDIPLGMVKGKNVLHKSEYTAVLAAEFPHDIQSGDAAPDAVTLYRQVLVEQEDDSVTLVSIGYLTNLNNLLQSQPDIISPLNGRELVKQKVKKLICMGGQYPQGREWNFYQDTASTKYVLGNWPSPITFCGFEAGLNIMTGAALQSVAAPHPVRRAYQLYNELTDRPSWDQVAVLYAVEGNTEASGVAWRISPFGENDLQVDGTNQWSHNPKAIHNYLSVETSPRRTAEILNQLMMGPVSQ